LKVTVRCGTDVRAVEVEEGSTVGAAIVATGLPLEQPCAGRGTCHKCKVIVQEDPMGSGKPLGSIDHPQVGKLGPNA